ncbi:hypothetical protein ADEAN_000801500 [Angomonas deanei]|uniref:Uncharacterized protein n=1 Tax=Angomonas deanei TaxID=59799 RepID=A0A7G2CPL6_9TRYP|nr:hypothetical protein ADEAN_000801500 [Angomonas deanei]
MQLLSEDLLKIAPLISFECYVKADVPERGNNATVLFNVSQLFALNLIRMFYTYDTAETALKNAVNNVILYHATIFKVCASEVEERTKLSATSSQLVTCCTKLAQMYSEDLMNRGESTNPKSVERSLDTMETLLLFSSFHKHVNVYQEADAIQEGTGANNVSSFACLCESIHALTVGCLQSQKAPVTSVKQLSRLLRFVDGVSAALRAITVRHLIPHPGGEGRMNRRHSSLGDESFPTLGRTLSNEGTHHTKEILLAQIKYLSPSVTAVFSKVQQYYYSFPLTGMVPAVDAENNGEQEKTPSNTRRAVRLQTMKVDLIDWTCMISMFSRVYRNQLFSNEREHLLQVLLEGITAKIPLMEDLVEYFFSNHNNSSSANEGDDTREPSPLSTPLLPRETVEGGDHSDTGGVLSKIAGNGKGGSFFYKNSFSLRKYFSVWRNGNDPNSKKYSPEKPTPEAAHATSNTEGSPRDRKETENVLLFFKLSVPDRLVVLDNLLDMLDAKERGMRFLLYLFTGEPAAHDPVPFLEYLLHGDERETILDTVLGVCPIFVLHHFFLTYVYGPHLLYGGNTANDAYTSLDKESNVTYQHKLKQLGESLIQVKRDFFFLFIRWLGLPYTKTAFPRRTVNGEEEEVVVVAPSEGTKEEDEYYYLQLVNVLSKGVIKKVERTIQENSDPVSSSRLSVYASFCQAKLVAESLLIALVYRFCATGDSEQHRNTFYTMNCVRELYLYLFSLKCQYYFQKTSSSDIFVSKSGDSNFLRALLAEHNAEDDIQTGMGRLALFELYSTRKVFNPPSSPDEKEVALLFNSLMVEDLYVLGLFTSAPYHDATDDCVLYLEGFDANGQRRNLFDTFGLSNILNGLGVKVERQNVSSEEKPAVFAAFAFLLLRELNFATCEVNNGLEAQMRILDAETKRVDEVLHRTLTRVSWNLWRVCTLVSLYSEQFIVSFGNSPAVPRKPLQSITGVMEDVNFFHNKSTQYGELVNAYFKLLLMMENTTPIFQTIYHECDACDYQLIRTIGSYVTNGNDNDQSNLRAVQLLWSTADTLFHDEDTNNDQHNHNARVLFCFLLTRLSHEFQFLFSSPCVNGKPREFWRSTLQSCLKTLMSLLQTYGPFLEPTEDQWSTVMGHVILPLLCRVRKQVETESSPSGTKPQKEVEASNAHRNTNEFLTSRNVIHSSDDEDEVGDANAATKKLLALLKGEGTLREADFFFCAVPQDTMETGLDVFATEKRFLAEYAIREDPIYGKTGSVGPQRSAFPLTVINNRTDVTVEESGEATVADLCTTQTILLEGMTRVLSLLYRLVDKEREGNGSPPVDQRTFHTEFERVVFHFLLLCDSAQCWYRCDAYKGFSSSLKTLLGRLLTASINGIDFILSSPSSLEKGELFKLYGWNEIKRIILPQDEDGAATTDTVNPYVSRPTMTLCIDVLAKHLWRVINARCDGGGPDRRRRATSSHANETFERQERDVGLLLSDLVQRGLCETESALHASSDANKEDVPGNETSDKRSGASLLSNLFSPFRAEPQKGGTAEMKGDHLAYYLKSMVSMVHCVLNSKELQNAYYQPDPIITTVNATIVNLFKPLLSFMGDVYHDNEDLLYFVSEMLLAQFPKRDSVVRHVCSRDSTLEFPFVNKHAVVSLSYIRTFSAVVEATIIYAEDKLADESVLDEVKSQENNGMEKGILFLFSNYVSVCYRFYLLFLFSGEENHFRDVESEMGNLTRRIYAPRKETESEGDVQDYLKICFFYAFLVEINTTMYAINRMNSHNGEDTESAFHPFLQHVLRDAIGVMEKVGTMEVDDGNTALLLNSCVQLNQLQYTVEQYDRHHSGAVDRAMLTTFKQSVSSILEKIS